MKLFVAEKRKKGYSSATDYHWIDGEDILMFRQFQTEENRTGNDVSMCGIQSRKATTHILVKDLDIPEGYLLELITESVEKSMQCVVNEDGDYKVDLDEGWDMSFNINDMVAELTEKASYFKDSEKVYCRGRKLMIDRYKL